MFTLSNTLSFLRAPLALLFLSEHVGWRICAIVLAMVTDSIDGYLARRNQTITQLGTILDPVMDKFFVFFTLAVLLIEGKLEAWQACALISRDFALCVFGLYLLLKGRWAEYQCKAIRWGKISTALQFIVLVALTFNIPLPGYVFIVFIVFGLLALLELCQINLLRGKRTQNSG